jgi:hypothetical protein
MYEELIKRLKDAAKMSEALTVLLPNSDGNITAKLYNDAADAIEELSMKLHGDEAAISGMKREIERMVVAGKHHWIPVTERLPKDNERVLIARVIGKNEPLVVQQAFRSSNGWWKVFGTNLRDKSVKFWMPMPTPPAGEVG